MVTHYLVNPGCRLPATYDPAVMESPLSTHPRTVHLVVTGVTGQVAEPVALALAARATEVVGAARFKDGGARARLEAGGVRACAIDFVDRRCRRPAGGRRLRVQLRRGQVQRLGRRPRRQRRRRWRR